MKGDGECSMDGPKLITKVPPLQLLISMGKRQDAATRLQRGPEECCHVVARLCLA